MDRNAAGSLAVRAAAAFTGVLLLCAGGAAQAFSGGITGQSTAGCRGSGCHGSNVAASAFNYTSAINGGLSTVAPNASTDVTVQMNKVSGANASAGGFNMSVTGSGTLQDGVDGGVLASRPYLSGGELTHGAPRAGAEPSWVVRFVAGNNVGSATLRVCVNPVNLNGSGADDTGDGTSTGCTTRSITVNSSPTANANTFNIAEDSGQTAALNLLGNDSTGAGSSDDGGDSISIDRINGLSGATIGTTHGTVTRSGNTVRYTPDADYNGTDSFSYRISDSIGATDSATVTINISAVNDAPVAVADTGGNAVSATEDTTATFTTLDNNDTDIDGDALFINAVTQGNGNGVVSVVGNAVRYVPAADFCGTKTFTYQVRDRTTAGTGLTSGFANVTVNVACTPDAPIAVNDAPSVPRGSVNQVLPVLANDSDPDNLGAPFNAGLQITTASIVSSAMTGEALSVTAGNGSLTYTPPSNFSGQRTLSYTISDGTTSVSAQVNVTVQSGVPPVAVQDPAVTVDEDSLAANPANSFTVIGNDTDADGDSLTIAVGTLPANGTLTGDGTTQLTYVPNANFSGNDSFSYRARDSALLLSNEVTVPIVVTPAQDPPVAVADALSVARGSAGNLLDVLLNDTDVDNQSGPANANLTVTVVSLATGQTALAGESAVVASAGSGVRYTPPTDFSGTRLFDYTITDGNTTASSQVTVTVLSGSAPVAVQDGPFTVTEDSLATAPANAFAVLGNDTDADLDTLSVSVTAPPANGTLTGDGGTGSLTYQPNANFYGADSFRYRARDSANLLSNEITVVVNVTAVPDAPVAVADAVSVARGSTANALAVLGNDTDVDNLAPPLNAGLTVTTVSVQTGQPAVVGEQAVVSAAGSGVTYTPPRNFSGTRTLLYTISDGASTSSSQIAVTVLAGTVPVAVQDGPFTVNEDSLASDLTNAFNVLGNDSDPDFDTLSISVTAMPTHGTLSGDNGTLLTYQPAPNYAGPDSFRYRARDSATLLSNEITVAINVAPQPDAPDAAIDSYPMTPVIFREDQGPFDLDVLANDTDLDEGDTRQVISVVQGNHGGTIAILGAAPGNAVRYTPAVNFNGTESFSYTIQDSAGLTDTATVSVEISPVNDAPSVTSTAVTTTPDAQVYRYQVAQADVDDTVFTYALSGAPTTGTPMSISPTGLITWTPPISSSLSAYTVGPITVTVTDSGGAAGTNLSATQTFSITVTAPDTDTDGMPDSYESANGFNPGNAADGAQDRDGDGRSNSDEYRQGTNPDLDDVAPVIVPPPNLQVISTGFLTAVNLGRASASDVKDGVVPVQGPTPAGPFRPGRYTITYAARDAANNTVTATQQLDVLPRIELGPDQVTGEGRAIGIPVVFNGVAPSYPVTVDYTVGGTASSADHDAVSGRLVIPSGTGGVIPVNITADGTGEPDETIVVTLTANGGGVFGTRVVQTTTITERNLAPQASLLATQMGEPRTQIFANQGVVTIAATAVDPNAGDTVTLDFTGTDAALGAPAGNVAGFGFDPAALAPGTYRVRVTARDAAGAASTVETALVLRASAPALTAQDSDGDGLADNVEGFVDADGDGAPDYLDPYSESFVVADQNGAPATRRLLEAASGVSVRLGATALAAGRSGALVSPADVVAFGDGSGPVSNGTDGQENVGGLFDFELLGVMPGASTSVVIPLQAGLRPGSVWRKYASQSGWRDFVIDGANRVASAAAVGGLCPAPSSLAYVDGLTPLHSCVRLTLQDGGPNDADGEANGRIRDPGGAAVAPTAEPESPPSGKHGGGGSTDLALLLGLWTLAFAGLYRNRRRRS